MNTNRLTPYINLLSSFVAGNISATDLETQYLNLYKNDATLFPDEEFFILDDLFGNIDAFVANPNLRDEDDLDEKQLLAECVVALDQLKQQQSQ